MKIVVNRCFGGFGISIECRSLATKLGCSHMNYDDDEYPQYAHGSDNPRTCMGLVRAVEILGSEKASAELAKLEVIEIPDNTDYEISYYDGIETIHEKHNSW